VQRWRTGSSKCRFAAPPFGALCASLLRPSSTNRASGMGAYPGRFPAAPFCGPAGGSIQNGVSRSLISQNFLPKSDTIGASGAH